MGRAFERLSDHMRVVPQAARRRRSENMTVAVDDSGSYWLNVGVHRVFRS